MYSESRLSWCFLVQMLKSHFLQCWLWVYIPYWHLWFRASTSWHATPQRLQNLGFVVSKTRICGDLHFRTLPSTLSESAIFLQFNDIKFFSVRFHRHWSFLSFPIPIFLISYEVWWWKKKVHHKFLSVQGRTVFFASFQCIVIPDTTATQSCGGTAAAVFLGWEGVASVRSTSPMCADWVLNHLARQLPSSGVSLRHKFLVFSENWSFPFRFSQNLIS